MKTTCIFLVLLVSLFLTTSCSKIPDYYQEGMNCIQENPQRSVVFFQLAIAHNNNSVEAHRQLARFCQDSPLRLPEQIWHLQQMIELSPEGTELTEIRTWLQASQQAYLKQLKQQIRDSENLDLHARIKLLEEHSLRQKQWVDDLTRENQTLRNDLAKATSLNK